jgi:CRP/FNR family cyclic AMP-dependent transcriptional regulator
MPPKPWSSLGSASRPCNNRLVAGPSVELLQRVPLFAELPPRELEQLSGSFKEQTFAEGETAAGEGERGSRFYVIESGQAVVTVHGEVRGRLGPGDYFGDVAIIDQGDRSASIQARSELKCHGLTFWDFRPLVESDPRVAWPLLQAMAKRLRAAESEA